MSDTDTETPASPPDDNDVPDPVMPEGAPPPEPVEPLLSMEEFAMLEEVPSHHLAALKRWNRFSFRGDYATASQWQERMRQLRAYVPR